MTIKLYILLNSDIDLTVGQACAQSSHITHIIIDEIVRSAYEIMPTPDYYIKYLEWCGDSVTIVKKTSLQELEKLKNSPYCKFFYDDVYDKKLRIKIRHLTAIGFYPGCIDSQLLSDYSLM